MIYNRGQPQSQSQGLQKLSGDKSNKKNHGQETKRKLQPTIK